MDLAETAGVWLVKEKAVQELSITRSGLLYSLDAHEGVRIGCVATLRYPLVQVMVLRVFRECVPKKSTAG